ncbi:MAG: CoA-binding protein [Bryobacter sp.]|nr:CoA-binding protein [Bryobacter sp.]
MKKTIEEILDETKTIAVVGLSSKRDRSSYGVSEYLQQQGYRIIPVNPNETEVLGERAYASLEEIPEPVDMVNVFRRAEETPAIAAAAVAIGAKTLWLQQSIVNEEAAEIARAAGLSVVMDACLAVAKSLALKRQ